MCTIRNTFNMAIYVFLNKNGTVQYRRWVFAFVHVSFQVISLYKKHCFVRRENAPFHQL
uniref:Uncharacterized protein n=1 Tax=Anguilla anguilla TaxID=7936 RepID=A0A0E9SER7_ANGAN